MYYIVRLSFICTSIYFIFCISFAVVLVNDKFIYIPHIYSNTSQCFLQFIS